MRVQNSGAQCGAYTSFIFAAVSLGLAFICICGDLSANSCDRGGSAGLAMRVEPRRSPVLDCLMIASGAGFFVVAILYVVACEKM